MATKTEMMDWIGDKSLNVFMNEVHEANTSTEVNWTHNGIGWDMHLYHNDTCTKIEPPFGVATSKDGVSFTIVSQN